MNEDFIEWECPLCGDVCHDPLRMFPTECHNQHQVEIIRSLGCARIKLQKFQTTQDLVVVKNFEPDFNDEA